MHNVAHLAVSMDVGATNTAQFLATAAPAADGAMSGQDLALVIIAVLGLLALALGHLTRNWVSEVIVFLVIGVAVGPEGIPGLQFVQGDVLTALQPVIAVALGAIVFGIGERLEIAKLIDLRHTLTPFVLLENLLTFVFVFFGTSLGLGLDVTVAFLLAAISLSTSPTTLIAVIGSKKARGSFTEHLLAATALNNVMSALLFGLGLPVLVALQESGSQGLVAFGQLIGASVVIGLIGGACIRQFMAAIHSNGERLLFIVLMLVLVVGASGAAGAPVVISTLVMGAFTANDKRDTTPVFASLRTLEAPIFLVFFIVAGANFHLDELSEQALAAAVFVIARTAGKVIGGATSMQLSRAGRRSGWGPWLGLGLTPFAGMAIGLAAFTTETTVGSPLEDAGQQVAAIVLASVAALEILGPGAVGRGLVKTGEAGRDATSADAFEVEPEHLIRHILVPVSSVEMARRKAGQVVDLAASAGAVLTVLHVRRPGENLDPEVGDPALSHFKQVALARDVQIESVSRSADSVVDAIVSEARNSAADLVVIGEPLPSLIGGGGRRIVHDIVTELDRDIPVLVVPTRRI